MNVKRIIAGITALALTASVSGFSVFAEDDLPENEETNAVTDAADSTYGDLTYSKYYRSSDDSYYIEITDCSTTAVSVDIPASIEGYPVTIIGRSAFLNCKSLTSVTIPSSVTSISFGAFDGCSSLTSVTIPSSVTSIDNLAFNSCSSLTSVTIPSSVTSIGSNAFGGCRSLTSVSIPSSVTTIKEGTFRGCSSLTSVDIPSSVTTIDSYAFSGCSALTSVTIPSSVTTMGTNVFNSCKSLKSVNISSSVKIIGDLAFYNCSALTSVSIPSSVTTIREKAFSCCSSLTSVNIPSSVTTIGDNAFYNCSSLTSVNIPSSVTSIGSCAFDGCSSLTSVNIPSSVSSIEGSTFYNCSSLTSVTIPSSVTSIGSRAFDGCSSLTSVNIPSSVTSIGNYAFNRCSSLESVYIPPSVKSIGNYAFYDCSSLTSVIIPSSVTSIGSSAFSYCSSLTSVTIPSSVTSIGRSAFCYCTSLRAVAFSSKEITIDSYIFNGCNKLKHIHIPEDSSYTDFYTTYNCLPSDPSCYYTAEGECTCSLGKRCPFVYDEILNQYIVKVIDQATGDVYVNAIVKSADGNYSAVTDGNGRAYFDIADNDEYFWNNDITFEVYFDGNTKLGSENAVPASLTDNAEAAAETDASSAPVKMGQKSTSPNNNSQDTIIINKDKMITSVSYKNENILMSRPHKKPSGSYRTIRVNESYDSVKYTPTGDKLKIDFAEGVPGNGYRVRVFVTDAQEIRNNSGNLTGSYQSVMLFDEEIGDRSSVTIDSFSDVITKKMNDDKTVTIRPESRILILVFKSGESLTEENNYYLTPNIGVYSDVELQRMSLLDTSKLQSSLGTFNTSLPIPENDYFEADMFLDLSKNQVGFTASLGCEFEDKNNEEYTFGEYDFDSLEDAIKNAKDADFKKQWEQIKNQKYTEKYGLSIKPMATVNAAGTIKQASVVLEGSVQAGLTAGFTGSWRIPQLANLAHIDAGVGVEGMATAGFSDFEIARPAYQNMVDFNKPFAPDNVTIDLSATGKLGAGVGIGDIVDASVTASLTGKSTYDVSKAVWKNISLSGDVIAKEKILCYEATQDLANAQFRLVDENGNTCGHMEYSLGSEKTVIECPYCESSNFSTDAASPFDNISAADFTLIPRRSGEEHYVDPELNFETDASSLSSKQIIATNVYEVSDPVIVNAGGTDYLFRFVDNQERSVVNGSTLVYSKKVNGAWSEPVMISDDGTADFDASVCTDGTDIYVSWSNISEELSDTALYTDAIEKTTISVAKLDTKTDTVSIIGTADVTGKSAISPSITVKNGTGIVAWTSNTNFDPLLNSGNDSIYYSTISGGKLSSPALYASTGAGKTAGVVRTGYMGSELCIVYGCMESGGETETSELYGSVYTSAPVQLTSDSVPDTNPQFEKIGGQDKLFWYKDGCIVYSDSLGGEAEVALSGIIGDKYAIASSGDVTKIAWRDETDEGNVLKMVSYEDGAFTNNYIGNELGVDPSQFTATIDSNNMLQIAYTYSDGGSCTLALTSEVEDEKVTVSGAMLNSSYKAGDTNATLSISVYNSGNRDIEAASINISDSAGNIIGTYPISDFDLDIGISKEYDIDITLPQITDLTAFTVSVADIDCEPATFEVGYTEMYITGDVYEAGGMRFADITVHNDSTVATSGSLAVIIDGEEVARSQLSSFDCTANSLSEFNLSELMGGNNFNKVEFVLEGTKQSNFAGSTTLEYNFGNNSSELSSDVAENIKLALTDDGSVRLTWDAIDGADTYYIYRYLDGEFTLCGSTYKLTYTVTDVGDIAKCGFIVVPSDMYDLNQFIDKVVFLSKRSLQDCIDYINELMSGEYKDSDFFELTDEELEMIETILKHDYEKTE